MTQRAVISEDRKSRNIIDKTSLAVSPTPLPARSLLLQTFDFQSPQRFTGVRSAACFLLRLAPALPTTRSTEIN